MTGLTEDQERDDRAAVRIRDRAEDLAVYLASWQDKTRAGDQRRQALTEAVDAIDALQRAAHDLRQSLVSQARRFDDDALARADELLRRLKREHQ